MYENLENIDGRYEEINMLLSDNDVINNQTMYRELLKEHSELSPVVMQYRKYKQINTEIREAEEMLSGSPEKEFKEMIETELEDLKSRLEESEKELKTLLIPKDPNDDKNVIIEIRAGAGGEEAALFAANLLRAYTMYADRNGWKTDILDSNPTEIGGFKEVICGIEAVGAYSRLKFESGVHRVQRVPDTESSGRIHTSTITVAVLPEVEDDVDIEINPNDIEIDTYRASGAGGQHINKTDSAIRITHKPSGIVVTCQDQRSQHKNKDKAMKILKSKLYDIALQEQINDVTENRRSQVGTGDRSERIRTYNFPQGRVTDHRIGLTLYKLEQVLNGDLDEIIDSLITSDRAEKLSSGDANDV